MSIKHIVQANQNIFDVLLQETGSIEGIFGVMSANPDILTEVGSNINIGDVITIPDNIARNIAIQALYEKKNITISTGAEIEEGIGFWSIEENFIVT